MKWEPFGVPPCYGDCSTVGGFSSLDLRGCDRPSPPAFAETPSLITCRHISAESPWVFFPCCFLSGLIWWMLFGTQHVSSETGWKSGGHWRHLKGLPKACLRRPGNVFLWECLPLFLFSFALPTFLQTNNIMFSPTVQASVYKAVLMQLPPTILEMFMFLSKIISCSGCIYTWKCISSHLFFFHLTLPIRGPHTDLATISYTLSYWKMSPEMLVNSEQPYKGEINDITGGR